MAGKTLKTPAKAAKKTTVTRAAAKRATAKPAAKPNGDASKLIDQRIRDLKDWRGETLARVRSLTKASSAPARHTRQS